MKQKLSREDEIIRDFLMQVQEYELAKIPSEEFLMERYPLSDMFYQRMERLIKLQERKVKHRDWRRWITATVAVLMLMFTLANPKYVAEAAERIIQWFSNHVSFNFYEEGKDVDVVPRYTLEYVPEGYEIELNEYYENSGVITYLNDREDRLFFLYSITSSETVLDNEGKEFEIVTGNNGERIYYFRDVEGEESSMTWVNDDGTIYYVMTGILDEKELLKIIDNIQIVEES